MSSFMPQRQSAKASDRFTAPMAEHSSCTVIPLPDTASPTTDQGAPAPRDCAALRRPLTPIPLFRPDAPAATAAVPQFKQASVTTMQQAASVPAEGTSSDTTEGETLAREVVAEVARGVVQPRVSVKQVGTGIAPISPNGSGPPVQRKNITGLPDALKAGVEALSGVALDDVRVHYNSPKPAAIGALAYAQGTEIHVGSGQEPHLPHEAWHVVQQKQGRVQPTLQAKGLPVNDDTALEREADAMGVEALRTAARSSDIVRRSSVVRATLQADGGVVQGVFDWAIDAANNRRKMGVEITEDRRAGNNGLGDAAPTALWAGLTLPQKQAQWPVTVNLPNYNGGNIAWRVAPYAAINTYFAEDDGKKETWMRWGEVKLTEDYGDFEWIINHPNAPQGVTYYRDRLADVSRSRAALRAALLGLGLGGNKFVLAMTDDPGPRQALWIALDATNDASSQITIESTDRAKTKQGLMEGLTHGLSRLNMPNRSTLMPADHDVVNTVTTAAARVPVAHVDMSLIVAYLIGDVTHKLATLTTAADWGGAVAANFKQWRVLFPKSHPYQVFLQALDPAAALLPPAAILPLVSGALIGQRAAIIGDIRGLFLAKLVGANRTAQTIWHPLHFTGPLDPITGLPVGPTHDPGDVLLNASAAGIAPPLGVNLAASLDNFLNANHANYLDTEFDSAVNALTDPTRVQIGVVRSTGFAVHAPNTAGFAFEDRAEVDTTFPGLATTYERIKAIANRY